MGFTDDQLTSRLRRRRSSSIRKLSIISLSGVSRLWKSNSIFGNNFKIGPGLPFDEVRERALAFIENDPQADQLYDPRDVQRAQTNNWFIQRFVIDRSESTFVDQEDMIEDSTRAVIECMKWRKEEGLNDIKSSDFPRELYQSGSTTLGKGQQGNPIVFVRGKFHRKIPEWAELLKLYSSYFYELADKTLEGRSMGLVIDFNGTGIRNFDLDYNIHVLELFTKYFPMSCSFVYLNDVSWLMKPGMSLLLKVVPSKYQKIVKFTTQKSLLEILGSEHLPFFLGGTAKCELFVPSDAPSIDEVAERHGISKESTQKLKEQLIHAKDSA